MIELTCSFMIIVGLYLCLDADSVRKLFGLTLLSTAINTVIVYSGRIQQVLPAFVDPSVGLKSLSNPVPQALTLTAIVIGFGLLIFLAVLIKVVNKT